MCKGIEQGQVVSLYAFVLLAEVMDFPCPHYSCRGYASLASFSSYPGLSNPCSKLCQLELLWFKRIGELLCEYLLSQSRGKVNSHHEEVVSSRACVWGWPSVMGTAFLCAPAFLVHTQAVACSSPMTMGKAEQYLTYIVMIQNIHINFYFFNS